MTSQSLRNRRTILWSMRPKTDLFSIGCGLARRLRVVGLTGLALAVLASATGADESPGRARLETGSAQSSTKAGAQSKSAKAKVAREKKPPEYWQSLATPKSPVPALPASRSRFLTEDEPIAELLPAPVELTKNAVNSESPGLMSSTRQQPAETESARTSDSQDLARPMLDWESDVSSRMGSLAAEESADTPPTSVGAWWSARTQGMLDSCRQVRHSNGEGAAGGLRQTARNFIDNHTLPEEVDLDQDVYDSKRIALAAPMIDRTNDQENSDVPAAPGGQSRLKTDIRSIQPTLGYALKNIKSNQLPDDFDTKLDNGEYVARATSPTVLQWAPTNFYHYPLYFEDPSLERYGHTYHPLVQPFASTGRFATQLVGLPYQMTLHPVASREYALGYYRPGECAPKKHYQIPFNEEATLMEVAVIAGLILVVP